MKLLRLEKFCRICRKNRKGAAVVEFAVVLPIFLLLVFGMIEFGRVVMVQQLLTNATREGARVGVLSDSTDTQVKTRVVDYLTGASISATASDVTVSYATDATAGDSVTVSVSMPFSRVSWLPTPQYLTSYTMVASSSMRREVVD